MKIATVLGARPQFIKAASFSRALKNTEIQEFIIHTGQHYDLNMSDIFFDELDIPKPHFKLNIRANSHAAQTAKMMEALESVMLELSPDLVLVYGDTNSTLAAALTAAKLHIKIAHIEAGLRSFNMKMPEEINRILTDRLSAFLFCPTDLAVQNLEREGFGNFGVRVVNSGDVMFDGALYYKEKARRPGLDLSSNFVLATIHRAENTDDKARLESIFSGLREIAKHEQVVLPLHPRTKGALDAFGISTGDICVTDPVGYLEMIWLLLHCSVAITDSGGLQKEAYFFGKRCVVARDETEWSELVDEGANVLVGGGGNSMINAYLKIKSVSKPVKPLYGDGRACEKIVKEIIESSAH